jgi:hypothetical protein
MCGDCPLTNPNITQFRRAVSIVLYRSDDLVPLEAGSSALPVVFRAMLRRCSEHFFPDKAPSPPSTKSPLHDLIRGGSLALQEIQQTCSAGASHSLEKTAQCTGSAG